jgi:hypothetical protein
MANIDIKKFVGIIILIVVIFFNEFHFNGVRLRYVALFLALIFTLNLVIKRKFGISNLLLITLIYFAVDVYLNGWYKKLGVVSGYSLYLASYLFFLAGEKSYDRVFFYRLSILALIIHTLFIFIQFFFPDIYNNLYFSLNIDEVDINRGYFFTGFRSTSILSSFDIVVFGGFCFNYLFFYKKKLKHAYFVFIIIVVLSFLLMSRSNLLVLALNLIFNLFYSKKYLLIFALIGSAFTLFFTQDGFTIDVIESSRNLNFDDGGRINYINQALRFVFSHNFIIGEYSENMNLEKAPHNVFINALLYFGVIGFILIFFFYFIFMLFYYKWFLLGFFEYLVISFFMIKTFFHNESIVTSGSLVFMFLLGGSINKFKSYNLLTR